jgi:hypothetical protein
MGGMTIVVTRAPSLGEIRTQEMQPYVIKWSNRDSCVEQTQGYGTGVDYIARQRGVDHLEFDAVGDRGATLHFAFTVNVR